MPDTSAFFGTISSQDMGAGYQLKRAGNDALNAMGPLLAGMAPGPVKLALQQQMAIVCDQFGQMGVLFDRVAGRSSPTFAPTVDPSGGTGKRP